MRCWILAALPCALAHSNLRLSGAQGLSQTYQARPAAWNAWLPNFGKPKLSYTTPLDRESHNLQPSFYGRLVMDPGSANGTRSLGCDPLVAAPRFEATALLVERGLCRFRDKALNAYRAGYAAVVVANTLPGMDKVPDMTAAPADDREVEVPAWAVSSEAGVQLRAWLELDHSIRLEIEDVPRRPQLGAFQEDAYGLRLVAAT
mmetsp:Transcript_78786/g.255263  ORF Transcript_78786/g.255263 Transcript_78786/m.255263 type:complete len:203 (-) Transcript_78786:214-822(-)